MGEVRVILQPATWGPFTFWHVGHHCLTAYRGDRNLVVCSEKLFTVFVASSVIDLRDIDSVTGSSNILKTSTEWQRLDINIQTAIIQPTSCFRSCQSNHTHRVTLQLPPGKFSFQIQSVQSWRSLVRMQLFILVLLSHVTMVTAIDGCYSDRDNDHRPRENCTAAGFTDVPVGFVPSTKVKSPKFVLCS